MSCNNLQKGSFNIHPGFCGMVRHRRVFERLTLCMKDASINRRLCRHSPTTQAQTQIHLHEGHTPVYTYTHLPTSYAHREATAERGDTLLQEVAKAKKSATVHKSMHSIITLSMLDSHMFMPNPKWQGMSQPQDHFVEGQPGYDPPVKLL